MRAVLLRETGGPEVLRLEEIDRPEPAEGEVLIRVQAAASINPIDWKYRRGLMPKQLPAVLGSDVSGTVEALARRGLRRGRRGVRHRGERRLRGVRDRARRPDRQEAGRA